MTKEKDDNKKYAPIGVIFDDQSKVQQRNESGRKKCSTGVEDLNEYCRDDGYCSSVDIFGSFVHIM